MKYKAAIFDLDDTLYDYERLNVAAVDKVRQAVCARLGVAEDAFDAAYRKARQTIKDRLEEVAACHNRVLYFQVLLESFSAHTPAFCLELYDVYWDAILDGMTYRAGAREFIDKMAALGLRIAICTDLTAHIQHRKLKRLGLTPDVLVTSEEAGLEKPGRVIFDICLGKLRLTGAECFYVGDSLEKDMQGAIDAGITPVYLSHVRDITAGAAFPAVKDFYELDRWFGEHCEQA
jgi:putative hydrolase of the HAD superfamily